MIIYKASIIPTYFLYPKKRKKKKEEEEREKKEHVTHFIYILR